MEFKVVFTRAALDDLEEIVAYVSSEAPRAAQRLANDWLKRAESLSAMPRRGQAIQARPGVRRLVRNPYLIIYRVDEVAQIVSILRFWHKLEIQNRCGWIER